MSSRCRKRCARAKASRNSSAWPYWRWSPGCCIAPRSVRTHTPDRSTEYLMKPVHSVLALALLAALPVAAHAERGFEVRDLATLDRVSSPVLSPDGRKVVFAKRVVDFPANKSATSLWIEDLAARDAAPPVRFTPEGWNVNSPEFSADGTRVYFLNAKSGSMQLYAQPVAGGAPVQLTDIAGDVGGFKMSPDGKRVALAAEAFADCKSDFACNVKRTKDAEANKASGKVFDRLFIRHWDAWNEGKLNRIFVADL